MNWRKFDPAKKLSEQVTTNQCWVAGYTWCLFTEDNPVKMVTSLLTNGYNPINRDGIYKYFDNHDQACELGILAIAEKEAQRPNFPEEFTLDG